MRNIILASNSDARKKLLKQTGLRFRVIIPRVREDRSSKKGYRDLVIGNALRKARAVARGLDSGVVISADTVVRVGRTLVGKPRNVEDALETLHALSRKPQWVYTGIAVIDVDNKKTFTAYEKTKVYMCPLSKRRIMSYFKKVSPLDKAGSFDVQGPGAFFIRRIEGCYSNVVGLPLAKLAVLLEKTQTYYV
ncbi:MAG: Maf family protein [bacterium]